ncbi:MAG: hypothetical protein ACUVT7_08990 [Thermoplasmata archaeon]
MDRVHQLLAGLCEEIERQVKPDLWGVKGLLVRGYLRQAWVFETEYGECTLFLDSEGNARVFFGSDKNRGVTIQWKRDSLVKVLEARSWSSIPSGDYPNVFVHTEKGRAAFNYLRKEIGL